MDPKLELVPYAHSPSAGTPSASPISHATAPNSPSIRDSGNLRLLKSSQVSPEESGKQGSTDHDIVFSEGSRSSDSTKRARKDYGTSTDQINSANVKPAVFLSAKKSELEQEMELYEAAERQEKAMLLTSPLHDQSDERSECPKSISSESIQTDWKLVPGNDGEKQQWGRKRGRNPIVNHDGLSKGEDVCFACLDGGDLILCDKRSCPKGYHLECTGREPEFFDQKGQWFCGWHVCAKCSKAATWHCYTCPIAYCNGCVKDTGFLCLRKGEGLCEDCYRVVNLLENNLSTDLDGVEVNFDDEETYECYFREYWNDMRQRLPLTWQEIEKAFKACGVHGKKGGNTSIGEDNHGISREYNIKRTSQWMKRRKTTMSVVVDDVSTNEYDEDDDDDVDEGQDERDLHDGDIAQKKQQDFTFDGWASRELINFLQSVNESSEKPLSMRSLKRIVWNYIDSKKLIHPRRVSHFHCDEQLQSLFGKKHVARCQMVDLLCVHLAKSPDVMSCDGDEDTELEIEEEKLEKQVKSMKKELNIDEERPQKQQKPGNKVGDGPELDSRADNLQQKSKNKVGDGPELDNRADKPQKQQKPKMKVGESRNSEAEACAYAAIDMNNISLIYLKRPLLEDLRHDPDFVSKVMKAFVRLRVTPSSVKQNGPFYRLVPIVGVKQVLVTSNNGEQTNVMLEVLNLRRREEINLGMVSSRDFTEDECRRLLLYVKGGYLKPMTVDELRDKARALREAKVKNYFETELLRITHLRDRASEKGRKKELRECIEKIQLLSSPAERERQLQAPLGVTADPSLCPNYTSDENAMRENPAVPENSYVRASDSKPKVADFCQQGPGCAPRVVVNNGNDQVDGHGYGNSNSGGLNDVRAKDDGGWGMPMVDRTKADGWDEDARGHTMDDGWGDVHDESKKGRGWGKARDGRETNEGGWGQTAGRQSQDDGWGHGVMGNTKDDGWGDSAGGNDGQGPTKKDAGWGNSGGSHIKGAGWGNSGGSHIKGAGWGNSGGSHIKSDGWGNDVKARDHSKNDGWGNDVKARDQSKNDGWGHGGGCHSPADGLPSPCGRTGSLSRSTRNQHVDNGWNNWGARSGLDRSRGWDGQASSRTARFDRRNDNERAEPRDGRPSERISTSTKDGWPDVGASGRASGPCNSEQEKVWYYHDLRKNLQGPFSMDQLRRWEKTKLFPSNLRIWRATESPDVAILLTDALVGRFLNDLPPGFAPDQRGMSPLRPGDRGHGGGQPGSRRQQHERGEGRLNTDEHKAGHMGGRRHWSPRESGGSMGSSGQGRAVFYDDYRHSHRNGGDDSRFKTRKKDFPCKYFARGMCRQGEECDFRH